ncbi:MAG: GNAT family N-acetyltransferase [Desulfobacterales bacterium]|nr:GNAT family N-acetyltransferase [Desulfobacterales bacterium]
MVNIASDTTVRIRHDFRPGDVGAIVYLHGTLYAEEYGFDHTFEPYVAIPLSEFVRSKTGREKIWIVEKGGKVQGSLAIVACTENQAQLRWLLLHPDLRGTGMGKQLVGKAVAFSREAGYKSVFLWTVRGLAAATEIYRSAGFTLTETNPHTIWGRELTEERYELPL